MSTKKQLQDRWKLETWNTLDKELYAFCLELCQHMNNKQYPFQNLNDFLDRLEHLPFNEETADNKDLRASSFFGGRKLILDNVDFSYCKLEILSYIKARNCKFDQTKSDLDNILESQFENCSFTRVNFSECNFIRSVFHSCNFESSKFRKADFGGADLRNSSFKDTDCRRADFNDCDLRGCNFNGADLSGIVMTNALIDKTTDFRGAKLYDFLSGKDVDQTPWEQGLWDETTLIGNDASLMKKTYMKAFLKVIKNYEGEWKDDFVKEVKQIIIEPDESFEDSYYWYEKLKNTMGESSYLFEDLFQEMMKEL